MTIFDVLSLVGGLALFLFGMNIMGNSLEKKAGGQLKSILTKMTDNPLKGFILGLIVTSIIQSSSATTVMVVGFVNSGIMTLHQSIGIIMGANVGTTITSWILSLQAVNGSGIMAFFKPDSFVPVLALVGIYLLMFTKKTKNKDTAMILLGFATLMTGMSAMSDAVAGLKEVPEFTNILTLFSNPVLGVIAGAVLTAIIQSSSASVGILQALSTTGAITFGTAIPIVMGMAIGTCITAVLSAIGANKNAKRTTLVHLYFNIFGTIAALVVFYGANAIFKFDFFNDTANEVGIAVINTAYKVFCVLMWAPLINVLEKMATKSIRDTEEKEKYEMLDERLLATPAVAVDRCKTVTETMAEISKKAIDDALSLLTNYDDKVAEAVLKNESKADKYEDKLGSYLVKVSSYELSDEDGAETAKLLHIIGDLERISDHAVNVLKSAEEINDKKLNFSGDCEKELSVMINAVEEIIALSYDAFISNDLTKAQLVEPLEQVVDDLKDSLKARHIKRLQKGECTIELGFVLTDLLTNLERISDHCSNIAGLVIESSFGEMDLHKYLSKVKKDEEGFKKTYEAFSEKYNFTKL
ncbi:MAG: Na/Pi cotransporter family protein [Acutalibacteraceae bacterium]|nr:Na/Pi cotransporter family protein [Acutalibacteraceae bacterium]